MPSLVSSGPGWFPRCLVTPSPRRLTLLSPRRLAPPSPHVACSPSPRIVPSLPSRPSSISPLVLLIVSPPPHRPSPSTLVPSPFLIVVVSSSLHRRVAPHRHRFGVLICPSDRVEASVRGRGDCRRLVPSSSSFALPSSLLRGVVSSWWPGQRRQ